MAVNDQESQWIPVGNAIEERVLELMLTKAELERASGVSFKTLQRYMRGEPIRRADKARALATALRWEPDAFDRLVRGEHPRPIGGGPSNRVIVTDFDGFRRSADAITSAGILAGYLADLHPATRQRFADEILEAWDRERPTSGDVLRASVEALMGKPMAEANESDRRAATDRLVAFMEGDHDDFAFAAESGDTTAVDEAGPEQSRSSRAVEGFDPDDDRED